MSRLDCRPRLEGLGLSLLASAAFLTFCAWFVYRGLSAIIGASKITGSISWIADFNVVLATRLAWFALTVVLMHVALGVLIWGLARLTRTALPAMASRGFSILVLAWALALFSLTLAINAQWYSGSIFAFIDFGLPKSWLGITLPVILLAALGTVVSGLFVTAWQRTGWPAIRWSRVTAFAVVGAGVALAVAFLAGSRSEAKVESAAPNVIILGIDSLRNDLSEVDPERSPTPSIDGFLANSYRFTDATTPLARTYPSWVSILTGRHPVSTNARFNLMPRSLVREGDTLADVLRARGYRTVYATDEVRFANFDTTYGFDKTITPPIGASDFVIGAIGDQPLINLVAGSPLGAALFPQIYANRADATTYRTSQFLDRLDSGLENTGPSLLAIHLTLSHWPYARAGQVQPTTPQAWRPAYREALSEVDRQFEDVLALLVRKGFLRNAFVVVLSDHGEALGYRSDSMIRNSAAPLEIWDSLWGHGTSVVSTHQYGVVLGLRAFGRAHLPGRPVSYDWPVSLEDVRPTLEELATGHASAKVDGISLVPYLANLEPASKLDERIRFTETCFNTVKLVEGKVTASGMLSEAGIYYEMAPESGWVQLRPDRLPEILAKKQRAAISRNLVLATIPSWTDDSVTYFLADRHKPSVKRFTAPPTGDVAPEAARLWAALSARFPGELAGPSATP